MVQRFAMPAQSGQDPWAASLNNIIGAYFSGMPTLGEREMLDARKGVIGAQTDLARAHAQQAQLQLQAAQQKNDFQNQQLLKQQQAFDALPGMVAKWQSPGAPLGDQEQGPSQPMTTADLYGSFLKAFPKPESASQAFLGMTAGNAPPEVVYGQMLAQGKPLNLNQMPTFETQAARNAQGDQIAREKMAAGIQEARIRAPSPRPDYGPSMNQVLARQYQEDIRNGMAPEAALQRAGHGKPAPESKPLSPKAQNELGTMADKLDMISGLQRRFRDDFASPMGETVGDIQNFMGRRGLGGYGDQADFWASVGQMDNLERHSLFGSALTAGEQKSWKGTTINPGMAPERIMANLAARQKIISDAYDRRVRFYNEGATANAAAAIKPELYDSGNPLGLKKAPQ